MSFENSQLFADTDLKKRIVLCIFSETQIKQKLYITPPHTYLKVDKEIMMLNRESKLQSELEQIESR